MPTAGSDHDASKIHLDQDGGAEEAGFVRVVQGHSDDLARMVRAVPGPEALAGQAPHILQEPAQENHRGLMADLRSFDLRDPQMLSPPGELPATEAAFNTTTTERPRPVSLRADQAAGHRSRTSGEDGRPRRPGHTWVRHLSPPELNR